MRATTFYQKISVEKEPEVSGWYDTNLGRTFFRLPSISRNRDYEGWFECDVNMNTKVRPDYYFIPAIPLEEWMVEFADFLSVNYNSFDEGIWIDPLTSKQFTTQELLTEFLSTKNYVQK